MHGVTNLDLLLLERRNAVLVSHFFSVAMYLVHQAKTCSRENESFLELAIKNLHDSFILVEQKQQKTTVNHRKLTEYHEKKLV